MTNPEKLTAIDNELENARSSFKTQKMSMSIGELCSLFKKQDLILNPNFQRVFRWNEEQQSRLIESILLGIPLPPIFIAQQKDSKWTVVDGLQRLSTIFKIEGLLQSDDQDSIQHVLSVHHQILKDSSTEEDEDDLFNDIEDEVEEVLDTKVDANTTLLFSGLKKLTELNGLSWKDLSLDHRRSVRRSFFEINIMYLESNTKAQYELFQRLNTGGSSLTPQEVRNCIIIMNNVEIFNAMNQFRLHENFVKITALSQKQMQEAYDMELINRFILSLNHQYINFNNYPYDTKIGDFIDDETINILDSNRIKIDETLELLSNTINFLYEHLGTDAFRRYYPEKEKFAGSFNLSAYEAVLIGVAQNINCLQQLSKDQFIQKVKAMYSDPEYIRISGRGIKVIYRFEHLISFSVEYFSR